VSARPKVLFISGDFVGETMAGVAVRAYELARALAPHADVTIAAPAADVPPQREVRQVDYVPREARGALARELERADAVVTQPLFPHHQPLLRRRGLRVINDLVTPEPFENLEYLAHRHALFRRAILWIVEDRVTGAMHDAHHLLCGSDKQRDMWIGAMLAERLIDPALYDRDPDLRGVIDTVPFGVADEPPRHRGEGPRERFGLAPEDEIVLWSGGIWEWLDADTAIRAVVRLAERRPTVKLVFMGASIHGPAQAPEMRAHELARSLGALGRTVFFSDSWVPYGERGTWMLEGSANLALHRDHLEARFAYRTRFLDCFWARLPIVCTRGDYLAARVEREGLGATAPPGDPDAVAAVLEHVLDRGREHYEPALVQVADEHRWERVAEPIVRYVTQPGLPPRLGHAARRRPAHLARDAGFRTALRAGLDRFVKL
jgi:glycosyltransferase involved in cell wall biosynthesis